MDSNAEINVNHWGDDDDDYVGDPTRFQYFSSYVSSRTSDPGLVFDSNVRVSGIFYLPSAYAELRSNTVLYGVLVALP